MTDFSPRVVATSPVEPTGVPVIDGVQTEPNDVILLTRQQNPADNGLFRIPNTTSPGAWTRRPDFNSPADMHPGADFYVCQGSRSGELWRFHAKERPAEVGVTPLVFVKSLDNFLAYRDTLYPFKVGLRVSYLGGNRIAVSEGAAWIPGINAVAQTLGFEKEFPDGFAPRKYQFLYFFSGNDGRLDAEFSDVSPEQADTFFELHLKTGDPTRRCVYRSRGTWSDGQGNLEPFPAHGG